MFGGGLNRTGCDGSHCEPLPLDGIPAVAPCFQSVLGLIDTQGSRFEGVGGLYLNYSACGYSSVFCLCDYGVADITK